MCAQHIHGLRFGFIDKHAQPRPDLCGRQYLGLAVQLVFDLSQVWPFNFDNIGLQIVHQLARRSIRLFDPVLQDGQPVTALGLVHEMGRNDHCRALIDQIKQLLPKRTAGFGIDG